MEILQPSIFDTPVFKDPSGGSSPIMAGVEKTGIVIVNFFRDLFPIIFSQTSWEIFKFIVSLLSAFFIIIIIYALIRTLEIRKKEHEYWHHAIHEYAERQKIREAESNKQRSISANSKWIRVLDLLSSGDSTNWKMAIIEADTMLDELLSQLGFQGGNIGEKLKSADPKSFRKMSLAWEAHTVRNKIAHEGGDFTISSQEANRIVSIYEDIFRDFDFI
ncbi:MAG: hypothetical protein K9L98_00795 [Candidatus Pacebacteria bacterium]|nr:hypothetical protein [Candidatus Paceibacterota bacterium]MCF7862535.1 hypothetical protein [Candidatus Paceibacterota bacterium]